MTQLGAAPAKRKLSLRLRRTFIAGLLIVVPLVITYVILKLVFDAVDGVLQPLLRSIIGITIPGLGIVAMVLLVFLMGVIATGKHGHHAIQELQRELFRLPIVGAVYSASEHLIESFSGSSNTGFKHVVVIEYPRHGTWTVGFLTGVSTDENGKRLAVVYIPTAPTPQSGWVAIVPIEDAYDTSLPVQEALKMVLSGGILSPVEIRKKALSI